MNWTWSDDFPSVRDLKVESAIELAKRLGTYNQIDRSKQYEGRYSTEQLRKNDDLIFSRMREEEDSKFWHSFILVLVSGAIARAPELYLLFIGLLRWLGLF